MTRRSALARLGAAGAGLLFRGQGDAHPGRRPGRGDRDYFCRAVHRPDHSESARSGGFGPGRRCSRSRGIERLPCKKRDGRSSGSTHRKPSGAPHRDRLPKARTAAYARQRKPRAFRSFSPKGRFSAWGKVDLSSIARARSIRCATVRADIGSGLTADGCPSSGSSGPTDGASISTNRSALSTSPGRRAGSRSSPFHQDRRTRRRLSTFSSSPRTIRRRSSRSTRASPDTPRCRPDGRSVISSRIELFRDRKRSAASREPFARKNCPATRSSISARNSLRPDGTRETASSRFTRRTFPNRRSRSKSSTSSTTRSSFTSSSKASGSSER